jgi:hypothetical protein
VKSGVEQHQHRFSDTTSGFVAAPFFFKQRPDGFPGK